eukprot:scaffold18987_cov109-Isochrysis_galbana.AAC.14
MARAAVRLRLSEMDAPQEQPWSVLGSGRLLFWLHQVRHAARALRLAPPPGLARQKVAREQSGQLSSAVGPRLLVLLRLACPRHLGRGGGCVRVGCVELQAGWQGAEAGAIGRAVRLGGLAEQLHQL